MCTGAWVARRRGGTEKAPGCPDIVLWVCVKSMAEQ